MKKILLLICALTCLLTFNLQAFNVSVSGQVTGVDGLPVGGVKLIVAIAANNPAGFSYSKTVVTADDGTYSDKIDVPNSMPQGFVTVSMADCDGTLVEQKAIFGLGIVNDFKLNFVWCKNATAACSVDIKMENVPGSNAVLLTPVATGTAPFTYIWSNVATPSPNSTLTVTQSGTYCVVVVDANGCKATACATVVIGDPGNNCSVKIKYDGLGTVPNTLTAVADGVAPFTYLWSTGETTATIKIDPAVAIVYCVTVTAADGCIAKECFSFGNNTPCSVELVFSNIGYLKAVPKGTAPFKFLWSTGETTQTIKVDPTTAVKYCVTVTDAKGCTASACFTYPTPSLCSVTIVEGNASLFAKTTGTPPFTYQWSTGDTTYNTLIDPNVIEYCVTVTDANGCIAKACHKIIQPSICKVEIKLTGNGTLTAVASGTGPFQFFWSNGETGPSITPNAFGLYCVKMLDANGCTAGACFTFGTPPPPPCSVTIQVSPATTGAIGWVLIAKPTGQPPFTYYWDNQNAGSNTITVQVPGTYCVTVVDAVGCKTSACVTVGAQNCKVEIVQIASPSGAIILKAAVAAVTYTYKWSTGETTPSIVVTEGGTYCVTVTTPNGCTASDCHTVNVTPPGGGTIKGFVFLPDPITGLLVLNGTASLFALDPASIVPKWVADTPLKSASTPNNVGSSYYEFQNVPPGVYIVRIALSPNSPFFFKYLPTYYGDVVHWNEAKHIVVPATTDVLYNVTLVKANYLSGPGSIGGVVEEGDGFSGNNSGTVRGGEPLPGVSVLLFDVQEKPVAHTLTDENGKYLFSYLAFGTYKVVAEIVGKAQASHWVTLSPEEPKALNLHFQVGTEAVTALQDIAAKPTAFNVFPNPVSDKLTVYVESPAQTNVALTLTTVLGKTVFFEKTNLVEGGQFLELSLGHLPTGIYFLNFVNGREVSTRRIVKE